MDTNSERQKKTLPREALNGIFKNTGKDEEQNRVQ